MGAHGSVAEVGLGADPTLDGFLLTSPSGRLQAAVAPADGGGVSSLVLEGHGELLHRANEFAPPPEGQWMGRAPLLWPAVGRNFTPEALQFEEPQCCFEHDGVVYDLPIHGFTRHRAWTPLAVDQEQCSVTLGLAEDEATLEVYPWPFQLRMAHALTDRGLTTTVTVVSHVELMFGIGNHLTLRVPGALEECVLATSATRQIGLVWPSLTGDEETHKELATGVRLTDPELLNGVLGGIEGEAWMTVALAGGPQVRVSQQVTHGTQHVQPWDVLFVMYGNTELGYYCPEPWLGRPNGLQTGRGVVRLPAGEPFVWVMNVDLEG